MIVPDAKEGDNQGAQPNQPSAQEEHPNVVVADVHTEEGAVGGEEDYPLDNIDDDEDDEDDEEEEMGRLLEQQDPNFDEMIDKQI